MCLRRSLVLFMLALAVVAGSVAAPSVAAGAVDATETLGETETANPTQTTTTPADGPDSHADDPFPSWLPLMFAAGLLVGIATVGGTLWFVSERVRQYLGR